MDETITNDCSPTYSGENGPKADKTVLQSGELPGNGQRRKGEGMKDRIIDWEAIEKEWRANIRSVRSIADQYGVSHQGINKKAAKEGWQRDLRKPISREALRLVTNAAVTDTVDTALKKAATEQEIIDANANIQKIIILDHRKDIKATREVANGLVKELTDLSVHRIDYEELGEAMRNPDATRDRRLEQFNAVLNFSGRVDSTKKLAETMKILIGLEREAFGIETRHNLEAEEVLQNLKIVFVA